MNDAWVAVLLAYLALIAFAYIAAALVSLVMGPDE